MKLMHHHDPQDGGVLLRMKPKTSGTLSETNQVWPGFKARNRRRQVVNARTDEKGM